MLAVIVPVGPGDTAWPCLLGDLGALGDADEIVLVAARADDVPKDGDWARGLRAPARWLVAEPGRARQLNAGVRHSTQDWLWFLHADSRVPATTVAAVGRCARADQALLGYCDLDFHGDGPAFMIVNTLGVWLRCRLFGLPFGDQGFLIPRKAFNHIGPYDETMNCGEDHALVWAARRAGLPVRPLRARIRTSARKYVERGWARTTLMHLWLTWRQARDYQARPDRL